MNSAATSLLLGRPLALGAPHDIHAGIPRALQREMLANKHEQYLAEYQPVGPTEHALTRELARQDVNMDLAQQVKEALFREGVRRIPELINLADTSPDVEDVQLAAAAAQEALQTWQKFSLLHNRAYSQALKSLLHLQAQRRQCVASQPEFPPGFTSEAACEAYLAERLARGAVPCGYCGHREGYYLQARRAWECGRCHRQQGLRVGTVMARSPLPLSAWFEAIRWLLWRPTIPAGELAGRLSIARTQTARALAHQIREAMACEDASALLAGLDQHFGQAADVQAQTNLSRAPHTATLAADTEHRDAGDSDSANRRHPDGYGPGP